MLASDVAVVYGHLVAPDGLRDGLPALTDRWQDFAGVDDPGGGANQEGRILRALKGGGRPRQFRDAVRAIDAESRPTLNWMHVFLPHEPLQYLPSGKAYQTSAGAGGPPTYDNAWLSDQAQQRHLLQMGFTDRLFGTLLARMRQTGLYDRALLVVVADHGISFRIKATPAPPFKVGQLGFGARSRAPTTPTSPTSPARQAAAPAPRPGRRALRAHDRRAPDDRRRARHPAPVRGRRTPAARRRPARHPARDLQHR